MEHRLITPPKRLKERSWHWRQVAGRGLHRGANWFNFWFFPLIKLTYRRNQVWSHTTPVLIVGQNPWLNCLLAWQLSFKHSEIMIWEAEGLDWWNYSILHTETFLARCKAWFPYLTIESLPKLMAWMKQETTQRSKITILDHGFVPFDVFQDEVSKCWAFKVKPGTWNDMACEGLAMSDSRRKAKEALDPKWPNTARATWKKECEANREDDTPCHYLLAEKVYWTTRPNAGTTYNFDEINGYKIFKKEGERMTGCASRIAQTTETFYAQPFEDTEEVLKTPKEEL